MNVHLGDETLADIEGREFIDLTQALMEASLCARDMAADLVRQGKALDVQMIELSDREGSVVERFALKDAVQFGR